MADVTDEIGNVLEVGDTIRVSLKAPGIIGKVMKITGGSNLLVRGKRNPAQAEELVTEGKVMVLCEIEIPFDPRTLIVAGVKVHDPNKKAAPAVNLQ